MRKCPAMEPAIQATGRFRLLFYLIIQPRTTTELAALESKHLSNVSRMLRELKEAGYVEATAKKSRERYYKVTQNGYAYYSLLSHQSR